MRWTVHGERTVYDSPWVRVTLADVEIPGGRRFEHHVVRSTAPAAGVIVRDEARGVLLLWRHRFITDTWGWEVPDHRFHLFVAEGATYVGEPSDPTEAERVEWVPVDEVRRLVPDGGVPDGLSLTALLWALVHADI